MILTRLDAIADLAQPALATRLQHLLDHKTKPLGSLGQLEALARQIGLVLHSEQPRLVQPQMVVFAADHGLAARGVSAFPSDVTWQMVENFLAGGAAVSVLARQHGLGFHVVDAGVDHEFGPRHGLIDRKIARGTADEVVRGSRLVTFHGEGPDIGALARELRGRPGVETVAPFGAAVHVSGTGCGKRGPGLPAAACR